MRRRHIPARIRCSHCGTGALMDEYIDELLDERAPLREPLSDEPDEEGFEL